MATTRRRFCQIGASSAIASASHDWFAHDALDAAEAASRNATTKKRVGAVVTVYRKNSHADVLLSKILRGWRHDGGAGPQLKLVSLYVDQVNGDDLSRPLATEHDFTLVDRIEDAVTLGTAGREIDGIISIGEHGNYPLNKIGQRLYPRRQFFDGIVRGFDRCGQVVPLFNDKHLGPRWMDAEAMYSVAKKRRIPFMAGSSIPVSFRNPDVALPLGTPLADAIGVGYGGLESYGFHALEFFQSFVERRTASETGIRRVQFLSGDLRAHASELKIDEEILARAIASVPSNPRKTLAEVRGKNSGIFVLDYVDGFRGLVLMLGGLVEGFGIACRTQDGLVLSCQGEARTEPRYPHFAYQLRAIETMFHTGQPAYPVERTLLVSGALDRLLHSRSEQNRAIATPMLQFEYEPVEYPYAEQVQLG